MRPLLPPRPSVPSLQPFLTANRAYYPTMGKKTPNLGPRRPPSSQQPQITHFLCLPLVNTTSLPQLEASLATFKAAIPSAPPPADYEYNPRKPIVERPLIPPGAIRPVGTLHLTLGVMSLPTEQRLNEAIQFLHSLDLPKMMQKAAEIANKRRAQEDGKTKDHSGSQSQSQAQEEKSPFTISLESLSALPRAKAASILHAIPVDPSSRLYPFCVMLRDEFLAAGFMQGEFKKSNSNNNNNNNPTQSNTPVAESPSKPKPRPLLLHATVVNTIYVKGRQQGGGGRGGNKDRNNRVVFDARDVLAHYRDYYTDSNKVTPRSNTINTSAPGLMAGDGSESEGEKEDTRQSNKDGDGDSGPKYPFVWAKDFPLDSVCICEMGAKKLDPEADADGMNARLGEKYKAVAGRSLDFGS